MGSLLYYLVNVGFACLRFAPAVENYSETNYILNFVVNYFGSARSP